MDGEKAWRGELMKSVSAIVLAVGLLVVAPGARPATALTWIIDGTLEQATTSPGGEVAGISGTISGSFDMDTLGAYSNISITTNVMTSIWEYTNTYGDPDLTGLTTQMMPTFTGTDLEDLTVTPELTLIWGLIPMPLGSGPFPFTSASSEFFSSAVDFNACPDAVCSLTANWVGTVTPVPIPAALPMFLLGLSVLGMAGVARHLSKARDR